MEVRQVVEEEGVAVVVARLLLPTPEQCRQDLALASQRTFGSVEQVVGP